ncbi:hypothetical protein [Caulobacter sp. Root1472]|uniref:hypothetical protein n=1 Tax=Caulobacter sp. Root1472 TaxID=1736470 RepID=UPI0006F39E45|nr:hypothetical protein [Caulobacter sp. Root1472]KQZ30689.1 hypothetical protein ASD47_18575 [Caulobacter sp. Root1472]
MKLLTLIWPKSRQNYSQRAATGRVMHVALIVIGSMGVMIELLNWHGRWDHLALYAAMWLAAASLGRGLRFWVSRE